MRLSYLLLPLLALAALPAAAEVEIKLQNITDIGLLPEQKLAMRPEDKIDPKRPNPFAERVKTKEVKTTEVTETEEIKIRRIFDTLKISGITKSDGKYTALLGDLILEEGAQVAPVIANQTQILRVTRVTEKLVQIAWIEGTGMEGAVPRSINKLVELSPRVGVLLAGQPEGSKEAGLMTYRDENGKVVWPKKMTPNLDGMMANLPDSVPAGLSMSEATPETPSDNTAAGPALDPATAIEDTIEATPSPEAIDNDVPAAEDPVPSRTSSGS
jgi:hypothetical protein